MIFAVSMTPSSAPPSGLVTRVHLSLRLVSLDHLASTFSPSGSMGYLSAAGAASGSAAEPEPGPALQPARPMRPAVTAVACRKFLLVTFAMSFSLGVTWREWYCDRFKDQVPVR